MKANETVSAVAFNHIQHAHNEKQRFGFIAKID